MQIPATRNAGTQVPCLRGRSAATTSAGEEEDRDGTPSRRKKRIPSPSGWLTPLTYIRLGRETAADEHIALVRLIVPSTEGHNDANTNVYACFYEISYMRSR